MLGIKRKTKLDSFWRVLEGGLTRASRRPRDWVQSIVNRPHQQTLNRSSSAFLFAENKIYGWGWGELTRYQTN